MREAERKRRVVAVNTFSDAERSPTGIGTFDTYRGKRNVLADTGENTYHAVVLETIGVEGTARNARRFLNVGKRNALMRAVATKSSPRRLEVLHAGFLKPLGWNDHRLGHGYHVGV